MWRIPQKSIEKCGNAHKNQGNVELVPCLYSLHKLRTTRLHFHSTTVVSDPVAQWTQGQVDPVEQEKVNLAFLSHQFENSP